MEAPELDYYSSLREANVARSLEWTAGERVGPAFRAAELAGEMGEILEWLFLSRPVHPSVVGRLASFTPADVVKPESFRRFEGSIVDECSDVVICLDLTAMDSGIGPFEPPPYQEAFSSRDGLSRNPDANTLAVELAAHIGLACNVLKKFERAERGWKGSRASKSDLRFHLFHAHRLIFCMGYLTAGHRFAHAVADKFNATSEKVGLLTRYVAPA